VGDAGTAGARVCSGAGASGLGLRLFPHTHGVDGFFIAKLRRER
jgi:16S rRNA C967 or C1407 C5-methylase (RsmB/RsmF family)